MSKRFERALESATDQTLVDPNWEAILECVDFIRGGDIPAKPALALIQKRYHNENPHVAHHALLVLEACVKNCGKKFHDEIATKEFMNDFKNVVIEGAPEKVSNKVLELIQCWSFAFREKPEYKIVGDTHSLLKMNGFDFPALKEADAMFLADSAPEWADGANCFRCRVEFGLLTRKHHCRACGQVFCDKCTNCQMLLPQFGIEKKVRVCGVCYEKQMKKHVLASIAASATKSSSSSVQDPSSTNDAAEKARIQELLDREQEELQLALAISQSEAEAKEQERQRHIYRIYNGNDSNNEVAAITSNSNNHETSTDSLSSFYSGAKTDETPARTESDPPIDPNLAKYLDRDYWERKKHGNDADRMQIRATAPPPSEISMSLSSRTSVETTTPTNFNNTFVAQNGFSTAFDQFNGNKFSSEAGTITPFVDGVTHLKASNPTSSNDDEVAETTQFCKALKEQVDVMDNRMKSNQMRGRSIVNDSAIHSLFVQLTDLHAGVLARMTKLEQDREYYERLQDHVAHIQEARQAVNALREEHDRQRQERLMEEQRQRQHQMQQKLEMMRVKKQEMLVHQRHMALQRFQEHEQQIQQRRMQQVPYSGGGYYVQQPANYPNDPQQSQQYQVYAQVSGQQHVPMYYPPPQYGTQQPQFQPNQPPPQQPPYQMNQSPQVQLHSQSPQVQMHSQSPQIPNQPIMTQGYAQLPGQQHVPMYYQPPPQYAPQPQYQQNQTPQLQQDPNQQALDLTAQQQQPHPPAPQAHQIEETPLISFD